MLCCKMAKILTLWLCNLSIALMTRQTAGYKEIADPDIAGGGAGPPHARAQEKCGDLLTSLSTCCHLEHLRSNRFIWSSLKGFVKLLFTPICIQFVWLMQKTPMAIIGVACSLGSVLNGGCVRIMCVALNLSMTGITS